MAWLGAVPDKSKESRKKQFEQQDENHPALEPPDIECGAHLLDYLQEVGPALSGGMGAIPISFTEIMSWSQLVGLTLSSWEVSTLKQLSDVYVSQYSQSSDPNCPAPYQPKPLNREELSDKIKNAFRMLAKRKE